MKRARVSGMGQRSCSFEEIGSLTACSPMTKADSSLGHGGVLI